MIGLTGGHQIAIGPNIYELKFEFVRPQSEAWEIVHEVAYSVTRPMAHLGSLPLSVEGQIEVPGCDVHATIADIQGDGSERKFSYVDAGQEVYCWVRWGSVGEYRPKWELLGGPDDLWLVPFRFTCSRTMVYHAFDDSPLWVMP